ncbi:flagellar hook-length control protein FliK [Zhongshania sp.]|uniref:flagellar hook-length control protein FliK n=1 Tax=Zhongshania sp. TaxID=1971902 RepID=UPI00356B5E63
MPSSPLPALSSSEAIPQGRAAVKAANSGESASQLPFNQLLAGNLDSAVELNSAAVEASELPLLATAPEDAVDVLLLNPEGGKALPLTGKELPLSASLIDGSAEVVDVEVENTVVNWQQVQIDWSRSQSAKNVDDGVLAGSNRAQQAVDQLLLQQEKLLQGESQAKSNLLVSTATQNTPSTVAGGFAGALQGVKGEGLGLAQAKGLQTESLSMDEDFSELASLSQLKSALGSANGAAPRAAVALTMNQSLVDNPGWGQAMAARIGMMVNNGVHTASMQLHPAELGSIHIQLSMNGDNTSVQFQAQNSEASDLIEKMLPRLSSSFEQQGLRLDEVKVSHNPNLGNGTSANGSQQFAGESAGQQDSAERAGNNGLANNAKPDDEAVNSLDLSAVAGSKLAVDYYA